MESQESTTEESPLVYLCHPSTCLISGPTGCGKTSFVSRLVQTCGMVRPQPTRIVWVYSEWQDAYENFQLEQLGVEFRKCAVDTQLYESFSASERNLLILDDQMSAASSKDRKEMTKLFTQGSHHRNLTIFYCVQNLFEHGPASRTISLNSQYIVLFKNPRDSSQIQYLAQQIYPKNRKFLVDSYIDATQIPHSYLMLNLTQNCDEWARVCTNIFPNQATEFYVPNDLVLPSDLVYNDLR